MKAVVAGSTGLIGSHLLQILAADAHFTKVAALCRQPGKYLGPKVEWQITNLDNTQELTEAVSDAAAVFCCLGTTIKKAKTKEAFRKVDYDYVLNLANAAHAAGCKKFLVVSAIGSDPNSKVLYSRVKGEMEMALKDVGFEQLSIFQPSILTGAREEFRLGERIGIGIAKLIAPLMVGSARKYRPIQARDVAYAMVAVAENDINIIKTLTYKEIMSEIQILSEK